VIKGDYGKQVGFSRVDFDRPPIHPEEIDLYDRGLYRQFEQVYGTVVWTTLKLKVGWFSDFGAQERAQAMAAAEAMGAENKYNQNSCDTWREVMETWDQVPDVMTPSFESNAACAEVWREAARLWNRSGLKFKLKAGTALWNANAHQKMAAEAGTYLKYAETGAANAHMVYLASLSTPFFLMRGDEISATALTNLINVLNKHFEPPDFEEAQAALEQAELDFADAQDAKSERAEAKSLAREEGGVSERVLGLMRSARERWGPGPGEATTRSAPTGGRRSAPAPHPDEADRFEPGPTQQARDLEELTQKAFRLGIPGRPPPDGSEDSEYMSKVYMGLRMGDGKDPRQVLKMAYLLWPHAQNPNQRFQITKALMGRQILQEDARFLPKDLQRMIMESEDFERFVELVGHGLACLGPRLK
jgi:hypothetical protein